MGGTWDDRFILMGGGGVGDGGGDRTLSHVAKSHPLGLRNILAPLSSVARSRLPSRVWDGGEQNRGH